MLLLVIWFAFVSLWLVALVALLCVGPPRPLPSDHGYGAEKKNVLLVIAHPDDESMFFTPTLLSLAFLGLYRLQVLCLSTGNAEGLGAIRRQEMLSACVKLKVPMENVEVLDDASLQDGHSIPWRKDLIMQILQARVSKYSIDIILTFDGYGVSGHPNHSAVYQGVCAFLLDSKKSVKSQDKLNIEAWVLESVNILKKYSGPISILQWVGSKSLIKRDERMHRFVSKAPQAGIAAMRQHKSQWLWYRRLFVIFSHYTYINTLHKI